MNLRTLARACAAALAALTFGCSLAPEFTRPALPVANEYPADAPAPYATTTIYYRGAENKVEAEYLAENFFAPLEVDIKRLEPGTADIKQDVQLAIFLGSDYAAQVA